MNQLVTSVIAAEQIGQICCPICSAVDVRSLATVEGQSLMKCGSCRVAYLFPQPAASEVTAQFEKDEIAVATEREQRFESNREPVLARVANYIYGKQPGDILDVGCATGYFLTRFFSGSTWRRWGVELSPNFAQLAAANDIRVYCGDVSQAEFPTEQFDAVTVLDAFYYFRQPQVTLLEFRRILKCDGILLLELPFGGSRIWRATGRLGRFLSGTRTPLLKTSNHLFYYSPQSITVLLKQCGFEVQAICLLPGNKQAGAVRNAIYKSFYYLSLTLKSLSRSKLFLGPRFLVAAVKKS